MTINVLRVGEKVEIKSNLYKQDIIVSDATSTTRLTLWQGDIDSLENDESYEIKNLMVKSYNNAKYLIIIGINPE